jgi:hypothetical protein
MQTLSVMPEAIESSKKRDIPIDIKVDKVDLKIKIRVLEWLMTEVKLIKN